MRRTSLLFATVAACAAPTEPGLAPDSGSASHATVYVVDDGVPVTGARVVFHTPAGEVASVVVTDRDGAASARLEPSALITIAAPNELTLADSGAQLLTYAGVLPGDTITVEIPAFPRPLTPPSPGPILASLRVELPPLADAGYFVIHLGCIDYTTEDLVTVVDVPADCLGTDDRVDLTVDAYTPPDLPARLATTFAANVVPSDGVTLPAWTDPVPSIDVELVDIPAGATNAFAIAVMTADGLPFPPVLADSAAITSPRAILSPGFLPAFTSWMDLEVRLYADVGNVTRQLRYGAPAEPTTYVSATELLPTVRDVSIDAEAKVIAWTATGDPIGADGMFLHLESERRAGAITRRHRWTVVAPPDTPSPFALPALPPALEAYRPQPGDDYLAPGIVVFGMDWVDGPATFLADHGSSFLDDACVPTDYASSARLTHTGAFHGPDLRVGGY